MTYVQRLGSAFPANTAIYWSLPKDSTTSATSKHTKDSHTSIRTAYRENSLSTYRRETGNTGCNLPPFLHICLPQSASHCRLWQTQQPPIPLRICTLGHYCKMLHNAVVSYKLQTKWRTCIFSCMYISTKEETGICILLLRFNKGSVGEMLRQGTFLPSCPLSILAYGWTDTLKKIELHTVYAEMC